MEQYQLLQTVLKNFINGENTIVSYPDFVSIIEIAKRHQVNLIIDYLCGYGKTEFIRKKNISLHLQRLVDCQPLFEECRKNKIQYAIIKGAYLEKVAYKDCGFRGSNDIDLLIRKKDIKRITEILVSNGFVCMILDWDKKEYIECTERSRLIFNLLFAHQSCSFFKKHKDGQSTRVDINFGISWGEDPMGEHNAGILLSSYTRMVNYHGIEYKVLEPEAFLLQICLHSFRDLNSILLIKRGKYKLARLCDVYYYLSNEEESINLNTFCNLVNSLQYKEQVFCIFHNINSFFGKNQLIENVLSQIKVENLTIVDEFGISESEKKKWPFSLKERIMKDDLFGSIEHLITDEDKKKMTSIEYNM